MTPLLFMLLLPPCAVWGSLGLPELTRDVLERIRAATGQPIDTERFMPIPSRRAYQVLGQPLTRSSRYLGVGKDRFFEIFEQDGDGNELAKEEYEEEERERRRHEEEKQWRKDEERIGGGRKGGRSRKGRKRGKFRVEKGFRDIYHKDEETKSDFFWNNAHEEGKWIEYGLKKRKQEKSRDKGGEGRQEREKTEGASYEKKEDREPSPAFHVV